MEFGGALSRSFFPVLQGSLGAGSVFHHAGYSGCCDVSSDKNDTNPLRRSGTTKNDDDHARNVFRLHDFFAGWTYSLYFGQHSNDDPPAMDVSKRNSHA